MRGALTDKALPVQRAACEVLIGLYPNALVPPPSGTSPSVALLPVADMESLIIQGFKSFDGSDIDAITRVAHARLIGHLLASTQALRPTSAPVAKSPQPPAQDDDQSAAKSQPEVISKPLMQPSEMFSFLSSLMNKQSVTRKQRVGLIQAYNALFNALGASWIESHYALILNHLSKDLVSSSKVAAGSKTEKVWTRNAVGILLRDTIGERMLSEQGLISAVMEGVNGFLRPYLSSVLYSGASGSGSTPTSTAAFVKGQASERPPNSHALMVVLREIAGLLRQLGNAPTVLQELLGGGEVLIAAACSANSTGVRGAAVGIYSSHDYWAQLCM